jgi:hypothetical protein
MELHLKPEAQAKLNELALRTRPKLHRTTKFVPGWNIANAPDANLNGRITPFPT